MEVKPWVAAIVLVFFGAIIGVSVWAGGEWRSRQAPDLMRINQDGHLFVVARNKIFEYRPDGTGVAEHDLSRLGVEVLTGGMAFFSNGDVLLREGNYSPGAVEKILMFLRYKGEAGRTTGERLVRCRLQDMACVPLKFFDESFSQTFRLAITPDDQIFIADTSRHRLLWLAEDGQEIDRVTTGFEFPNQLVVEDGRVVVANTNLHELTVIPISDSGFAPRSQWRHLPLMNDEARRRGETWPVDLWHDGEIWYVLAQGDNLMHGALYRLAEDGRFLGRFERRDDSDHVSLAMLNGEVLLADFSRMDVYRYTPEGVELGVLASGAQAAYLDGLRKEKQKYQWIDRGAWIAFGVCLAIGLVIAVVLEFRHQANKKAELATAGPDSTLGVAALAETPRPTFSDPEVVWIPVNTRQFRIMMVAGVVCSLMLLVILSSIASRVDDYSKLASLLLPMLFVFSIIGFAFFNIRHVFRMRLGVCREWLLFDNGRGKAAIARPSEVIVCRMGSQQPYALYIGAVKVALGNNQQSFFDRKVIDEKVMPLLATSSTMGALEEIRYNWQHDRHQLVLNGVLVLIGLLFIVWMEFYRK